MSKNKHKEIEEIKLSDEYKSKALILIDDTIEIVSNKFDVELSDVDKSTIRNLSLDQVNVNVAARANLKYMWVFDTEDTLPVIVEKAKTSSGLLKIDEENEKYYLMKPNLSWTLNEENISKDGLTKEEFEKKVLRVLLEDFETAAFYGTLSYIS